MAGGVRTAEHIRKDLLKGALAAPGQLVTVQADDLAAVCELAVPTAKAAKAANAAGKVPKD